MTRLLNTPIIGPNVDIVNSSWIDMLAGLSRWGILRMPPDFCAQVACEPVRASITAAAAKLHRFRRMSVPPTPQRDIFEPPLLNENRILWQRSWTTPPRQDPWSAPTAIKNCTSDSALLHLQQISKMGDIIHYVFQSITILLSRFYPARGNSLALGVRLNSRRYSAPL